MKSAAGGTSSVARAALLGLVLGLHLYTRFHAQQVTPLPERHFYPLSYLVSLSLVEGRGFGYLLPRGLTLEEVWRGALPERAQTASPVLAFVRLAGQASVTPRQLAAYARDAEVVPVDPVESTRVLDIHVAALLWRLFGVSWPVYFLFYALVSTAACACAFFFVLRATGSFWAALAAALGFVASPLELYAGAWSTRDSVPLWFTALAFGALAGFAGGGRGGRATVASAFAVGAASLVGLGWRPDFQLVPPLVLAGVLASLLVARRPARLVAGSVVAFAAGCASVLLLLLLLGPGAYSQGGIGFHIAWYGETSRSNLLQTENAFQVARDDRLTVVQANYFARAQAAGTPYRAVHDTKDALHHRRCRTMYLELVRYQAFRWWSAFPEFLARAARLDRPTPLASEQRLEAFLARRPAWLGPLQQALEGYGRLVPYLALAGAVFGLLHERSRVAAALMAAYFVTYAAIVLAVLPETKHLLPLLLPVHVGAAIGLWGVGHALVELRRWPQHARGASRRLVALAAFVVVLALGWGVVGAVAHTVSRRQRERIVDAVRSAAANAPSAVEPAAHEKRLSIRGASGSGTPPVAYLLRVSASRPANLLLVHARGRHEPGGFLAYYTRHPIEPGANRLFFFNVVSGSDLGDARDYEAHVRLVGPARIVEARKLELDRWPLGLPLSLVFDEDDRRPGGVSVGPGGAATEVLPSPSEIQHLLDDPGAFLASYRPS